MASRAGEPKLLACWQASAAAEGEAAGDGQSAPDGASDSCWWEAVKVEVALSLGLLLPRPGMASCTPPALLSARLSADPPRTLCSYARPAMAALPAAAAAAASRRRQRQRQRGQGCAQLGHCYERKLLSGAMGLQQHLQSEGGESTFLGLLRRPACGAPGVHIVHALVCLGVQQPVPLRAEGGLEAALPSSWRPLRRTECSHMRYRRQIHSWRGENNAAPAFSAAGEERGCNLPATSNAAHTSNMPEDAARRDAGLGVAHLAASAFAQSPAVLLRP